MLGVSALALAAVVEEDGKKLVQKESWKNLAVLVVVHHPCLNPATLPIALVNLILLYPFLNVPHQIMID